MSPTPRSADDQLVHRAALRIGVQIAIGCAAVVVIVMVISLVLGHHRHQVNGLPLDGDGDRDDETFVIAVAIAGAVGVLVAGALGWYTARRAVRPLAEALQLQRRFVADAGHELRTPLTILHTRAQLLDRKITAEHPAKPLSGDLLRDSRVLAEIVDELLLSAQLAADPARASVVDLTQVVEEVTRSMQPLADRRGLTLAAEHSTAPTLVLGSAGSLRRAVLALIDNALAHTPTGGRIDVEVRTDGDDLLVSIIDDGEGIDPDQIHQLTERFASGPTSTHHENAYAAGDPGNRRFGLGLALVHQVVEAHRGTLTLIGRPGLGTTATIRLPALRQAGVSADAEPRSTPR